MLGALVYLTKALPAAIAMLALALLLMPFTWRKIRRLNPKTLGRLSRIGLAFVVFIAAMVLTPPSLETSEPSPKPVVASSAASTKVHTASSSTKSQVTNRAEVISDVFVSGDSYAISGTGAANTDYTVRLLDNSKQHVKTNGSGEFKLTLSKNAPIFGSMELVRDTNGLWLGGDKTVAKTYYALDKDNTQHSNNPIKPVIFGISNKAPYEMSGTYTPGAQIVVKSGSKDLAKAKVDSTGRFKVAGIKLDSNFVSVAIFERVPTGWFNSRDTKITDDKYVDIHAHKILASLPTYTKEATVSQSVPFTEQTVESGSLAKGETKVTQEGANGSKDIIYVVTYKGNKEISRQQKSEVVTKQSTAKITTVGTYVAPPAYTAPISCPNGTYTNSAGNIVCSPYSAPSVPAGATARCSDGTYSYSQSRRGTCSHHGGVASWL